MQRVIRSPFIQAKLSTEALVDDTLNQAASTPGVAVGHGRIGNLHGEAVPDFDGGKKSLENLKIAASTGCDCSGKQKCMLATATLTVKYNVKIKISMPPMPSGLSACEQGVVRAFMNNVLRPHENEHKRLREGYNNTTRRKIEARGCSSSEAKSALDTEAETLHADEAAAREQDAISKSNGIDPFIRAFDTSDCDNQPRR